MTPERLFFGLGALVCLGAVAAGAFGAHALTGHVSDRSLQIFETAARYQMFHGLALLATAWATTQWPGPATRFAGWAFVVGVVIFSGSLYAIVFGAPRWLGAVTPIGGLAFMAGWGALAVAALRSAG